MSWFENEGRSPLHTVFSQTRYIRNLRGVPFFQKADAKTQESILQKIGNLLTQNGFRKESQGDADSVFWGALAEKGFIDKDFLESSAPRALYFNEPCSLAVSLGGKEHITIRSLVSGSAATDSRNISAGAEELLDREFEFAYSETLGYLASRPSLCGSGVEFSSLMYLPSLKLDEKIEVLRHECIRCGAVLSPLFTAGDNAGDLYTLSYSPSHICDENEAIRGFEALQNAIIEEEKSAERIIFSKSSKLIIDAAWRAFGTLLYAKRLSFGELLSLSSSIRIALAATEDKDSLPPVSITRLNTLLGEGGDCSVISSQSLSCSSEEDCNELRADFVSKLIS
jgi:protein arginine kinase